MVKVYLKDSGLLEIPYVASESKFGLFDSVSTQEKRNGEFRVQDGVELNITNFQFASAKLNQGSVGITDLRSSSLLLGQNPLTFNVTCELKIPHNKFTNTSNVEELEDYENLLLMSLSRGYKQFYIFDDVNTTREQLFSLYKAIKLFGVEDGSTTSGTTVGTESKHLKVSLLSFNQNEGAGASIMSYQLSFELLWDL